MGRWHNGEVAEQPWVFRSRSGQWLAGAMCVISLACAVDFVIEGGGRLAKYLLIPLAVAGWAVLLFWLPSVRVADAVVLNNPLRRIEVPWAAIQRVDTKWATTLHTDQGAFAAFAAPAPSGSLVRTAAPKDTRNLPESSYVGGLRPGDLPHSQSGQVALVIRERWEKLRDSGELFAAGADRQVVKQWRPWPVIAASALSVAAIALAVWG